MKTIILFLLLLSIWIVPLQSQNLSEGFEGTTFPPPGWTVINMGGTNTWTRFTSTPIAGSASASILYDATAHNDWLITPLLSPVNGNSTISFFAKNHSGSFLEQFNVKLSTTGVNVADFTVTLASNVTPPATSTQYSYNLSAFIGQNVYVAIQAISTDKWRLYVDSFEGPPLFVPACSTPTALSASSITTTSATLGWLAPGTLPSNGYQWEVRTSGAAGSGATGLAASGSTGAGVTTTAVTGLQPATNYTAYVRSNCGGGDFSSWAVSSAFTTAAGVPFSEGFITTSTPVGWTTSSWIIGSTRGVTGNPGNNIYRNIFSNITSGTFFTTNNIGPLPSGVFLYFDYIVANFSSPYAPPAAGSGSYIVEVSTNNGSTYTVLETVANDAVAGWRTKEYNLSAFTGQVVKFKITGNWVSGDWDIAFDNFKVETPPTCFIPTSLQANATGPTTATAQWTAPTPAPANGYQWEVRTSGAAGSGPTGLAASGSTGAGVTTTAVTGLQPATNYTAFVRSNCGGGDFSSWAGPVSFTTFCNAVNVPYVQDFQSVTAGNIPACTQVVQAGNGNLWSTINNPGYGFTTMTLRYLYNSANPANTWYFIQGLNLTAGVSYRLSYNYGSSSSFWTEKLQVAYGTSATPAAMTNILADHPTINQAAIQLNNVDFIPPTTGVYFIGFRAYSAANQDRLFLDNISVILTPPPCSTPNSQPTALTLTPGTISISGSYTAASGATGHIVLRSTSPSLDALPQNNTIYSAGNTLGNATVVYAGTNTTTFTASSLASFTQYYFFVFAYNSGAECVGPVYNTINPLSGSSTTRPAPPQAFAAMPTSPNQISFTATANDLGHNIMIAVSTVGPNAFGTPTGLHPIGSTIPGGGVVLYIGPANEVSNHSNLTENTTYHYRAWSIVPGPVYSSDNILRSVKTPCFPSNDFPVIESFEDNLFPPFCWNNTMHSGTSNELWDVVSTGTNPVVSPKHSSKMARFNSYIYSTGNSAILAVKNLNFNNDQYRIKFWMYRDNGYSFNTDRVLVHFNTNPTLSGSTLLGTINRSNTLAPASTIGWNEYTFNLPEGVSGSGYFILQAISGFGNDIFVDDLKIEPIPTSPIFVVNPQQSDFGSQSIFSPSIPQTYSISNNGIGTITVSSISLTGADAGQFTLNQQNTLPILLGPDQSATVSVTFTPSTVGVKNASLTIQHNLNNGTVVNVPLDGIGIDPTITTFPYVESFDGMQFAPVGWSNTRTAGTGSPGIWERVTVGSNSTTSPKSGPAMAQFRSFDFEAGTKAELITPPINFPEGNYRVSFWMRRDNPGGPWGNNADKVNVYFNTSNSLEDAALLGTVHRAIGLTPVVTTTGWHAHSFFLPAEATGNGRYIILEAVGEYGYNIFIDDFSISTPMVVTHTATNLSCFGSNDGSIALNIQGGIPPLSVLWIKDGEILESTSPTLEQLSAGAYEYTVKEATGIPITNIVTITQPAAIASPTVTNTTVVYDGLVKTINAVAPAGSTLVWYEQAEGGIAVSAPAKSDAGIYNYWVAAKSDATGCESPRVAAVLTISKKALTVKADDLSKCQNSDLPTLTLTYTGFVANEGPAQLIELPVATTTALPNSPIGSYPITVSGGVSNNYSFIYQNGTLTVVRTPMVFAGGPGFVCVSEVFPIVAATATNFTSIVWTTSGNGTFSNANSINPVYTPGSVDIANGSVILTLTADPGSFCSGIDQMVLNIQNDLPVSVTITQDDTEICIGELVTFNAIPVNGGIAPVFQWKVNGQNAGTNSNLFTYLPSNGDVVTVVLTTSISCALNTTATSNPITVSVTPDLVAGVSISTPSAAVCDFTPATFVASPVNGGVNPIYQWKVNGVNAGTNSPQFTFVPVNGDEVSVMMTSSHSCAVVPVANSNVITMSVAPPFLELVANPTKGGTVSGGGNYPDGAVVTITAVAAAGWEFLNWRNLDGVIVSTEAIATYTINKCYDKLTATFSSTAKIAGQLRYFNENETIIPSPNNRSVFYVQIFENGQPLTPRQMVAHSLEMGLDSYYEFTGVESGKDYSIRIWEEAVNNTLANTWSWNNWGGATSADAFIISWMANMDPQLTAFPWIWPAGATALTPYSLKLADVNNNQMIANSDALMVMYRLLGEAGYSPFPGGAHNFTLATTKLDDHLAKSHPVAPEKIFTQFGNYNAATAAPAVYQEVLLTNVSDGTNIYNIYFVATGDLNTSYAPGAGNKQLAVLEYNNIIRSSKGDEVLIPVRISEAAELGAITLGFSYNTNVIEVLDVIGYDLFAIDNVNGTVKIAWYDHQGKSFGENQHIVVLKAKLINEITGGTRHLELLPMTEFADGSANVLSNVTLKTDFIESAAGIITNPDLLSISHSVYPNPFNGTATLRYTLPEAGKFTLTIYNHLGQEVTSHVEENQAAGAHEVKLNSSLFNQAGNYHYRLQLTNQNGTHYARGAVVFTK